MGWLTSVASKVAGPIVGGLFGMEGQKDANKANLKIAREQMDFQRHMSNTAHLREVRDLKKAGLNPILSAKLGGSSSPPGAGAHMENSAKAGMESAAAAAGMANVFADTQLKKEQKKAATAAANQANTQAYLNQNNATGKGYENDRNEILNNLITELGIADWFKAGGKAVKKQTDKVYNPSQDKSKLQSGKPRYNEAR